MISDRELLHYSALAEYSADAIVTKQLDGTILSWNAGAVSLYGYEANEAIGQNIEIIVPDDRRDELAWIDQNLVEKKIVDQLETVRCRKDGSLVNVSISAAPVKERDGTVIGASTITRNITKRVREEQYFRLAFRASQIAMFFVDKAGLICLANRQAGLYFGLSESEMVGKKIEDFVPISMQDRHATMRESYMRDPTERVMGAGRDLQAIRHDGRAFPVEIALSHIETEEGLRVLAAVVDITRRKNAEDEIRRINATLEQRIVKRTALLEESNAKLTDEITKRRHSEAKVRELANKAHAQAMMLHAVISASPDPIYRFSRDMKYLYASPSGLEFIGKTSEEVIGKTWREVGQPASIMQAYEKNVKRVFETSIPCSHTTEWTLGGRTQYFDCYLNPILDRDGVESVVCTTRNVTERVAKERVIIDLNRELARQAAALSNTNAELETFAYSVSHDLRAPLRYIDGYVGMLIEDASDRLTTEDRRQLDVVSQSAREMSELINDLLAFSKIGRDELAMAEVDMNRLVCEARNLLRGFTKGCGIKWKISSLPCAFGDESMLRLVWQNLIENATKYTKNKKEPVIEISGWSTDVETIYRIRDNGIGFDNAFSKKMFGVFERLHTKKEFKGTGIGLSNVDRIVQRHRGKIVADGRLGKYAEFTFHIPQKEMDP